MNTNIFAILRAETACFDFLLIQINNGWNLFISCMTVTVQSNNDFIAQALATITPLLKKRKGSNRPLLPTTLNLVQISLFGHGFFSAETTMSESNSRNLSTRVRQFGWISTSNASCQITNPHGSSCFNRSSRVVSFRMRSPNQCFSCFGSMMKC